MESGTITAHKPTNHLRGDTSLSFVGTDHIIMEQDEQEGKEHLNGRELAPILSYTTSGFQFQCNVDTVRMRPYQDCINLIGAYCLTTTPVFQSVCDCHEKVKSVRDNLNSNWKSYINYCASWNGGNPLSQKCNEATNQILTNEYYVDADGNNQNVPLAVISGAARMWSYKWCP